MRVLALTLLALLAANPLSSAQAQSNPAIDILNPFAAGSSQRELVRAIGTLCFAGNRLTDRLQQDCNALVGSAFNNDTGIGGALSQIVADNVNASIDRAQFGQFNPQLMQVGVRGPGGGFLPTSGGVLYAASEDFDRWSAQVVLEAQSRNRDRSLNEDGFDSDNLGLLVGLDRRFSANFGAGIALGFGNTEIDFSGGSGDQDIDQRKLLLYANWSGDNGLYLDVLASWQRRDIDQSRSIGYSLANGTSVAQRFTSSFDAEARSLAATLGYQWQANRTTLDGFLTLESSSLDVDGYRENASSPAANGAGWALAVPDSDSDLSTADLGLRASWAISGNRGVWLPQLEVAYVKVLSQDESSTGVQFLGDRSGNVGLSTLIFALANDREDDDYFRLSAGLVAQWAEGRSAFINLSTHAGESRYDSTSLTLGARFEF